MHARVSRGTAGHSGDIIISLLCNELRPRRCVGLRIGLLFLEPRRGPLNRPVVRFPFHLGVIRLGLHLELRDGDGYDQFMDSSQSIESYLQALAPLGASSIILFGSAAKAAFVPGVSDVDLFFVLPDRASPADRLRVRRQLEELEVSHGFRSPARRGPLTRFAERAAGHQMSSFVCSRADLLSGDVARIFGLAPAEAPFVDRILPASVFASAVTVFGEDLVPLVPLLPIRRLDVGKAFFNSWNTTVMSAVAFPLLPDATKYAMGAVKHSLHSCYFCYHLETAALDTEIEFFESRLGPCWILAALREQRRCYRRSFIFVLRVISFLCRLHFRCVRDNHYPLRVGHFPLRVGHFPLRVGAARGRRV